MLDQRRRRWAVIVQMLYKCFVFTGLVVPRTDGTVLNRSIANHYYNCF